MKTGELSKRLAITSQTINRWCDRYADFLSPSAKRADHAAQATYTQSDFEIIATIHYLATQSTSHEEIEARLRSGYRLSSELIEQIYPSQLLNPHEKIQKNLTQEIDSHFQTQKLTLERDMALQTAQYWKAEYEAEKQQREVLFKEIADLKYQLGLLKGELNSLYRQSENN